MILVFDLDDTLYEEITFVKSGFKQVAKYLQEKHKIPCQESFQLMLECLSKDGRGSIFNKILSQYGLYSKKNVTKCISIYRNHKPDIKLFKEAESALKRFPNIPLYIVTDGNKIVQSNKVIGLGLSDKVKFTFITHRYGIKNSKPSPYCFLRICEKEKALPHEVVYIADNPNKDFVGIKPLGFKTVRVLTGHYKKTRKSKEYEAEYCINSLSELTKDFINKLV